MKGVPEHNNRGCPDMHLLDRTKGELTRLDTTTDKSNCDRES